MKIASVAAVKARFSAYLRDTKKGPVVVTRNGKPVGVILSVSDDDDLEMLLLAHSPRFREILEAGKREIAEGKGIPHDQFWAELDAEYQEKPVGKRRRPKRQLPK
jgi:prevent-host-death family protein